MRHVFKATKQRFHSKRIFGFDIETHSDNKGFLLASIVGEDRYNNPYCKVFYNKADLITELKTNVVFRNAELYATNLGFDFMGTFFDQSDIGNFRFIERGSSMLSAKTYFKDDGFTANPKKESKSKQDRSSLQFIDSLNYAKMSVDAMGKLLGYHKLESPVFGKPWSRMNKKEQAYMVDYNIRDSEITYRFMKEIIIPSIEALGGNVNLTIASSAMSLFKNKYLGDYVVHPNKIGVLRRLFLGFYGGRTETFSRGSFENANYYDFNSLYPSVMASEEYPDPNSQRVSHSDRDDYIMHCSGVSEVDITIPEQKYPPLPHRDELGKVIFPYGNLRGSWSHVELKYAVEECGCKITKVYESIYYLLERTPFKAYVEDLYAKRREYQQEAEYNPMEKVTKLMMNSLFGKFGERFDGKGATIHKDAVTAKDIEGSINIEEIGDFYKLIEDQDPKAHCIPIWAIYVTAYGRIKLHKALSKHKALYCDTDSLITFDEIDTSTSLGDLKLEMKVAKGITIRPKMYACYSDKGKDYIKIKGLGVRYQPKTLKAFSDDFIAKPMVMYHHFTKFREAIRKGDVVPNQIVLRQKEFNLEDTKRDWGLKKFDVKTLQESNPRFIDMGTSIFRGLRT